MIDFFKNSRMPSSANVWIRAHRKGIVRVGIAFAALYLAYLAAANIFLNTSLAELAFNRKPERFHIAWSRAYSLYPGHIQARDVHLGGHTRRNQWSVSSTAVSGRIKVLPLFTRRLSFGNIEAEEVGVELTRDAPFVAPTQRRGGRRGWQLHFDSIHSTSLRALKLDDWTIDESKDANAQFAFDKTLGGPITVLPSSLSASSARVMHRDLVLARDARIDYRMTMAPHTLQQAQGFERIRYVDAQLKLEGKAPGLILLNDSKPIRFSDDDNGRVEANLSMQRGTLQSGGSLRWSAPLIFNDDATKPRQRLQVETKVEAAGLNVHVLLPKRGNDSDFIDAKLLIPQRHVEKTSARELLQAAEGDIALRWRFKTLRLINPLLSQGWLRLDGAGDLEARIRIRKGTLLPGSQARLSRGHLGVDIFDTVMSAQTEAVASVDAARAKIDFTAQRFDLAPKNALKQPYISGNNVRINLLASNKLAEFPRTVQTHILFDRARIPDLRAYNRNLPGNSLRFEGGSGLLSTDLRLDAQGGVRNARIMLAGERARVRLGPSRIVGDLALDTRIAQAGRDTRDYRIDALNLRLNDVHVDGDDTPWWAQVAVKNGSMAWRVPFRVQGDVDARMKDVSALLALFSARSGFPKWVGNIIDAGQVQATGRVELADNTFTLNHLNASNERIDLRARLRIADGKPQGALYAEWGVLRLGVALQNDQRQFHWKGAEAWYQALPPLPKR